MFELLLLDKCKLQLITCLYSHDVIILNSGHIVKNCNDAVINILILALILVEWFFGVVHA